MRYCIHEKNRFRHTLFFSVVRIVGQVTSPTPIVPIVSLYLSTYPDAMPVLRAVAAAMIPP